MNNDELSKSPNSEILYINDIRTIQTKKTKLFAKLLQAPYKVTLKCWHKQEIECQIDTGASVNVMGLPQHHTRWTSKTPTKQY